MDVKALILWIARGETWCYCAHAARWQTIIEETRDQNRVAWCPRCQRLRVEFSQADMVW